MSTRQYIGARYIPKFYVNSVDGSANWQANVVYEPLTFVTLTNAHMYISRKQVPATVGNPAENIEYWLDMGSYNGFIQHMQDEIDAITETTIPALNARVGTVEGNLSNEITARTSADSSLTNHINGEISNRIAADANLESEITEERETRASADVAINARIDEIIAPSGEAPSAAEVADARIGVDGVVYSSLGKAIRTQIGGLNSRIDTLVDDATSPIYANIVVTEGGYYTVSNVDGSLQLNSDTSNTFSYCNPIPVTSGDVLLISLRHTTVMDSIIFTDSDDNVVDFFMKRTDSNQTLVDAEYVVPFGATKLYLTTTNSETVSVVYNNPTTIEELDDLCRTMRANIENTDEYENITSFTTNTNSNFIVSQVTNKVIQQNWMSSSFVSTSIPCVEGEVYKLSFRHTNLLDSVIVADRTLTPVLTLYPRSYSASENISDLLVRIPKNGVVLCLSSTNAVPMVIKKAKVKQGNQIIVAKDGSGDYTKISDAINNAVEGSQIYVKNGTYDIISELGSTYFTNYVYDATNQDLGLTLPPNCKLKFAAGAKIVCNYTGDNSDIKEQWSPLVTTQGSAEFENITIEASNVKYCIHDEHGGDAVPYKVVFNNCDLYLDDSNNPLAYSKSCIGGGLGWYGDIEVKNSVFESVGTSVGGTVSYHSQVGGSGSSCKVNIHNNYFVGADNTVRVYSAYTGSGSQTTVAVVNNNSLGKAYMTDNIVRSVAYLNEVRA